MAGGLSRLSRLHSEFLRCPLENFSLYAKGRPLTLMETGANITKGLGADCNALSDYVVDRVRGEGFDARIIYFDNDVPEIDKTIEVVKSIDKKYHVAVEVRVNGVSYIVDAGLQFEEPIPLNREAEYVFPTKILRIVPRGAGVYTVARIDRGDRKIELDLDLNEVWTDDDHRRLAWNNFYRNIKLKFGVLRDGVKLGMRMNGEGGKIIGKTRNGVDELHSGSLESCAEYFGADVDIFRKGYENYMVLRARQGVV